MRKHFSRMGFTSLFSFMDLFLIRLGTPRPKHVACLLNSHATSSLPGHFASFSRCLFWTHFGHITKTVTADNSLLDIFNFYPGAASDGTAHRKLADLHNCSAAALCRQAQLLGGRMYKGYFVGCSSSTLSVYRRVNNDTVLRYVVLR